MRSIRTKFLVASSLLIFVTAPTLSRADGCFEDDRCSIAKSYRDCPAEGSTKSRVQPNLSAQTKQDNILKNRDCKPTSVKRVKVEEIRDPRLNNSFYPDMGVEVTGYVARVLPGGLRESCNCYREDLRDLNIELVADESEVGDARKHVIVEISPRWEQRFGFDDSNYEAMLHTFKNQIEGKWVTFTGWMFYDSAHVDQSESTALGNPQNWRATPWEVHPVTSYKVLPGRP